MLRRARGGFRATRRSKERVQHPYLALACEGDTEARYSKYLVRGRNIRIKPQVYPGSHNKQLIDAAISHAEEVRLTAGDPDIPVIPAALFDIEKISNQCLTETIEAVKYARDKGVQVWVSVPTIERWFIMHFKHIGYSRSKSVMKQTLSNILTDNKLPRYDKPGSARFYAKLVTFSQVARENCARSHPEYIQNGDIPCLCAMLDFFDEHNA